MGVVVITGSSSGFGMQAALAFARNGDTVVATMRNPGKATELRNLLAAERLHASVFPLDITRSDTFDVAVEEIVGKHGRIDVLINNAGVHQAGALEDISDTTFRTVMETNCTGPLLLTRRVLPHMRQQGSGLIIMMSSLSGIAGLPGDLPYAASKFALEGATEALRHEVDRFGIRVALVQAGMYKTGIMDRNLPASGDLPSAYPANSAYRRLIKWQLRGLRSRMPEALDPAAVAALFVRISKSSENRLRWPADSISEKVLSTMLAQSDFDRDAFLRGVAGTDWWSDGASSAPD